MLIRKLVPLLCALTLCLAASAALAETYRNDDHHYQVDIPRGWKRIGPADFATFEAAASQAASAAGGSNVTYLAVYTKDPGEKVTVPYMVIMHVRATPPEGMSYEDLAREFKADVLQVPADKVSKATDGMISNMSVGRAVVDAANNRLVATMDAQVGGGGTIRTTSISEIGKTGLEQFVMYSRPEGAARDAAELEAMLASFQFDEGHKFVPGSGARNNGPWNRILIYTAVGAIVGALIGLIKKIKDG